MNKAKEIRNKRDELLFAQYSKLDSPGLFKGKLGVCLYFFEVFQQAKEPKYKQAAQHILQEVYNFVHQNPMPTSFDNGLAGIAWGIHQLIKKGFLDGNTEELLLEMDDILFKVISEKANELEFGLKRGILGYLIYILDRLTGYPKNPSEKLDQELFTSLAVLLINRIHLISEENKTIFNEPKGFNLFWELPNYLYVLGVIQSKNLMPNKTMQMIRDISPLVLSLLPQNAGNCLNLLYGMNKIANPDWRSHAHLLKEKVKVGAINTFGLANKSLYVENGMAGLILLDWHLELDLDDWQGLFKDKENLLQAMQHLEKSEYWEDIKRSSENEMGLIYGLTGIQYALLYLKAN